jgi:Immunity protein 27
MKIIESSETKITGRWILRDNEVIADETAKRIQWLISSYLEKVAGGGWETLYKDPQDGRYWELTYSHSEWHGGGPPQLSFLPTEIANTKYKVID